MDSRLIYSPLEHYANTTPDAPALSYSGKRMSYRELHERSNQLANALVKNGVNAEDRIGIFLHKGLELGVAIYGILKAGCAFVPLDPFLPADRLSFIVDDCNIKILISSDSQTPTPVSYTHLRAHETEADLVCRLLLEKKSKILKSKCSGAWLATLSVASSAT